MKENRKKKIRLGTVMDVKYQIGMRVVKTSVAAMTCLIISLFVSSESFITVSVVSAIIALQQSGEESLRTSAFRIIGTLLGGILGVISVLVGTQIPYYSQWSYILIIPLMIIFTLYICNVFRLQNAAVMACVVLVIVNAKPDIHVSEAFSYSVFRVIETLVGVSVSTVINFVFRMRRKVKYLEITASVEEQEKT